MEINLQYLAPPTLKRGMESDAFVRVFVGPIGSSKSSGCANDTLIRSLRQKPGPDGVIRVRGAIVRNTYRELSDTTRNTFEQWWPIAAGRWYESDFAFRIERPGLEIEVLFRALDSPADVGKLLSLDLTWVWLNELRELPKEIFDGLQGRVGRYPSRLQGGPSWFGVLADTNPWHVGHWLHELFKEGKAPEDFELYEQPSGLGPDAENIENLPPRYYERLKAGKDSEWIACYLEGKYPSSDKGSIYGALLADLKARGGFESFDDIDTQHAFTFWDLGGAGAKGDATAFWVFCFDEAGNADFVDHYESRGKPLSHYFGMLKKLRERRGYKFRAHFLPHDSKAKTLQTGQSVEDMFREEFGGGNVQVVPIMALADGLSAGRWLLEQSTRFHPRCSEQHDETDIDGMKALREYRRKWDEENKVFSALPLHDWASHSSDAYRGAAVVVKRAYDLARSKKQEAKKKKPDIRTAHMGYNLNELWDSNEKDDSKRGSFYR